MPKDPSIKTVLVLGSGPIIISQGCEFDYSGTQACLALKEEGCKVVLINPNPASIMTDPAIADATYIEPLDLKIIEKVIIKERPDAMLPTVGGQIGINLALKMYKLGLLKKYNIRIIGVSISAITKTENRRLFNNLLKKLNIDHPKSFMINNLNEAKLFNKIDFPRMIRTSFTLGGSGSGIAKNKAEFIKMCAEAFAVMPKHSVLVEESFYGWKEFELEVIRDNAGNFIVVCSIENFDPLGVHTGDSITVAPALTLTDQEYQYLRDLSLGLVNAIGMIAGGCNVQFAINPKTGRVIVVEVNPRVSRSSALASKATGFPIARFSAKIALGLNLHEINHTLTSNNLPASFEPSIDYVVIKIPYFDFEKLDIAERSLSTCMRSVGETIGVGRSFAEALQKALRGVESGLSDLSDPALTKYLSYTALSLRLKIPTSKRLLYIAEAFRRQWSLNKVYKLTKIDPWFLQEINDLIKLEIKTRSLSISSMDQQHLFLLKSNGFSDRKIADLLNITEQEIRAFRSKYNIKPVYKRIDSCAAEFSTETSCLYSTYETCCEAFASNNKKIVIIGSGPNRIGQGIEFDYCCVHAILAIKKLNFEAIMINNNPATVSTDYNISNKLYLEPLTVEDLEHILCLEKPYGILTQFGGQTSLLLTKALTMAGYKVLGTSCATISLAEDRQQFTNFIKAIGLPQPKNTLITSKEISDLLLGDLSYPYIVRPSYILGGKGFVILNNRQALLQYLQTLPEIFEPILLEEFIEHAKEVDVDLICDGKEVLICGILEQIEPAGIHSGDSTCILPAVSLNKVILEQIVEYTRIIALAFKIVGFLNIQYLIKNNVVYVLEANPRASRTIPFISKAAGVSIVEIGVKAILGTSLQQQGYKDQLLFNTINIKQPIFSFDKFPGIKYELGPVMRSTGEAMVIGKTRSEAYMKLNLINKKLKYLKNITNRSIKVYSLQKVYTPIK